MKYGLADMASQEFAREKEVPGTMAEMGHGKVDIPTEAFMKVLRQ